MFSTIIALSTLLSLVAAAPSPKNDSRIVYGYEAHEGQFPYMSQMKQYGSFVCSSSIISNNYILTAAHCFDRRSYDGWTAEVGSISIHRGATPYQVAYIINHPSYNDRTFEHDIALVQVQGTIQFNQLVQPIAMSHFNVYEYQSGINSGWGSWEWQGSPSPNLKYLEQYVVSEQVCSQSLGRPTPNEVCVQGPQGDGSCSGDSGGPIAGFGYQFGVVSQVSIPCGQRPSVFTRVDRYLPWMRNYVRV